MGAPISGTQTRLTADASLVAACTKKKLKENVKQSLPRRPSDAIDAEWIEQNQAVGFRQRVAIRQNQGVGFLQLELVLQNGVVGFDQRVVVRQNQGVRLLQPELIGKNGAVGLLFLV